MADKGLWVPDQGDGTYRNPVLFADYSDPDAIRVGEDFCLVSSSFNHLPGLPVLHSKDLVNAQPGVCAGAKVGLFCQRAGPGDSKGFADFAWFRVE